MEDDGDSPEDFDFRDSEDEDDTDELPRDIQSIVEHLRETLTHDMALRAYRCRMDGESPQDDEELEAFMEDLISEAVNDEYDTWDDAFVEFD